MIQNLVVNQVRDLSEERVLVIGLTSDGQYAVLDNFSRRDLPEDVEDNLSFWNQMFYQPGVLGVLHLGFNANKNAKTRFGIMHFVREPRGHMHRIAFRGLPPVAKWAPMTPQTYEKFMSFWGLDTSHDFLKSLHE